MTAQGNLFTVSAFLPHLRSESHLDFIFPHCDSVECLLIKPHYLLTPKPSCEAQQCVYCFGMLPAFLSTKRIYSLEHECERSEFTVLSQAMLHTSTSSFTSRSLVTGQQFYCCAQSSRLLHKDRTAPHDGTRWCCSKQLFSHLSAAAQLISCLGLQTAVAAPAVQPLYEGETTSSAASFMLISSI